MTHWSCVDEGADSVVKGAVTVEGAEGGQGVQRQTAHLVSIADQLVQNKSIPLGWLDD